MEPQLPHQNSTPENPAFSSRTPEVSFPKSPEAGTTSPQETGERRETHERSTGAGRGDTATFQGPIVPSQPVGGQSSANDPQNLHDDTPMVAADEDLIEMEWVNKAKKIVNETKTDPYLQEREVSKLQASYLQKRYGKEITLPKDE